MGYFWFNGIFMKLGVSFVVFKRYKTKIDGGEYAKIIYGRYRDISFFLCGRL
jgi:hypothetical protein